MVATKREYKLYNVDRKSSISFIGRFVAKVEKIEK